MLVKRVFLAIILIGAYTAIMINYPSDWLKALGYRQGLELYARVVSAHTPYDIIYNPGLRMLDKPSAGKFAAVPPEAGADFASILDQYLADASTCIVECSQLDSWHTSAEGMEYLDKMRPTAYRAVIFDGGHHLPTLGLSPDLIIVPALRGYAVHSFMLDGIKLTEIERMARECNSSAIIATVPRMALVKNETSMTNIAGRILAACPAEVQDEDFKPLARLRMSKFNATVFAYIDHAYAGDPGLLIRRVKELGLADVKRIYLAFDFKNMSKPEAKRYCGQLEQVLELPVSCVNAPVKTLSVMWGGS